MAFLSIPQGFFRKKLHLLKCSIATSRIAIVGTVPSSFPNALLAAGFEPKDISLERAISQHVAYTHQIAMSPSIGTVYQCPSSKPHPDCVFVEDPVVMISRHVAFMGQLGHGKRVGEGDAMVEVIRRAGAIIHESTVRVDGGDVLHMPGLVFVGMSERTEMKAVKALQDSFDADAVSRNVKAPRVLPVIVQGSLHLKSVVTWVGGTNVDSPGFLVASNTNEGHSAINSIILSSVAEAAGKTWDIVWVAEEERAAANVLYIGDMDDKEGTVLVQGDCFKAVEIIKKSVRRMGMKAEVVALDTSEFSKANGALTCMSVII